MPHKPGPQSIPPGGRPGDGKKTPQKTRITRNDKDQVIEETQELGKPPTKVVTGGTDEGSQGPKEAAKEGETKEEQEEPIAGDENPEEEDEEFDEEAKQKPPSGPNPTKP